MYKDTSKRSNNGNEYKNITFWVFFEKTHEYKSCTQDYKSCT